MTRFSFLRTPLLCAAAFTLFYVAYRGIGGTGGLDPQWLVEPIDGVSDSFAPWFFRDLFVPLYVVPALPLLGAAFSRGRIVTESAAYFAFGSNEPRHRANALSFWALAARTTSWLGILVGIAACVTMEILLARFALGHGREDYFEILAVGRRWSMVAPIAGVVLGRIVFGGLAQAARMRLGQPSPPIFSRVHNIAQLCVFLVPWYHLRFFTWSPY